MPEDDMNKRIEDGVKEQYSGITKIIYDVIDGFGETFFRNVRSSPDNLKNTIEQKSAEIGEVLRKPIREYEKDRADLSAKLNSSKIQVSELQTALDQEQKGYISILEICKPLLQAFVKKLPEDLLESWVARLYKSDPENVLLEAMEPRLYNLEYKSIKQAEIEDKKNAEEIGIVTQYLTDSGVATIQLNKELKEPLKVGDWVYIKGAETDFIQPVKSIEIEHNKVTEAKAGNNIGLKVQNVVKEMDSVYRMV